MLEMFLLLIVIFVIILSGLVVTILIIDLREDYEIWQQDRELREFLKRKDEE